LLSLALGVLSLTARARALAAAERDEDLEPVFFWDAVYGLVAVVWIGSGLWRAFGGVEKGTDYYLSNHVFWTKMLLLAVLLVLEGILAATFVRWRIRRRKREPVSLEKKARLVRFHWAEFWLLLGMITMAALMARGIGVVKAKPSAERDLATGESIYRRYCVSCHQVDGRGLEGKLAADFRAPKRLAKPDSALVKSVTDGIPGTAMPAFRRELDDAEIRSVLAYVRKTYEVD
jgi:putative membrane protein